MFPTTDWGRLAEATRSGDSAGRDALAALCDDYRPPVVAYLRGRGWREPEAEDFAQEFFLRLVESRAWRRADRTRGRFRTFLLGVVTHVVLHQRQQDGAAKRGAALLVSLDAMGEDGFEPPWPPGDAETFDREWAWRVVEQAVLTLEGRFDAEGRSAQFAVLRMFLPGAATVGTYEAAAVRLNVSVPGFKSTVHRLRQDFRSLLRASVARTVSAPHEVDEELSHLRRVLAKES
jgi:RNA polymerase sigma-70 factor (ECF subfamily)